MNSGKYLYKLSSNEKRRTTMKKVKNIFLIK